MILSAHMSESPIVALVELSKVDLALGKLIAERRDAEREKTDKEALLKKVLQDIVQEEKGLLAVRAEYTKEETDLKYQQQKLVDRRKSLANLPSAKAQTAAGREIDAAQKQLNHREEGMLALLTKIESSEKKIAPLREKAASLEKEIAEISEALKERLVRIESDNKARSAERAELAAKVAPEYLSKYQSVSRKYTLDPIVPLVGNTCGGCYAKLVPQVALKVAKAQGPVQCPGCARILYSDSSTQVESATS